MGQFLSITLLLIWVAWCAQAIVCLLQVGKFASLCRKPRRASFDVYRPRAVVIVPFKGLEVDLDVHIKQLCAQEYPDYRVLFVVDSSQDPVVKVLERQLQELPEGQGRILIAGPAGRHEGQKVHNLMAAIRNLLEQDGGEQVWVFADSDAAVGSSWLSDLVGPLGQPKTGVTTGYRWMVPHGDHRGMGLWSNLASVFNGSVACFAGRDKSNLAWGGSMAIRVETALQGNLLGWWKGSLSDDYQISAMCRQIGLRIYFVPKCLVAGPVSFNLHELLDFAYRQYVITRTHTPKVYATTLGFHSLYMVGLLSTWIVLGFGMVQGTSSWLGWGVPLTALVVVCTANQFRANFRRSVVRLIFGDRMLDQLRGPLWLDRWATSVWMTLHWLLILRAAVGRTIQWRSIRYRIDGPQDIRQLGAEGITGPLGARATPKKTPEGFGSGA